MYAIIGTPVIELQQCLLSLSVCLTHVDAEADFHMDIHKYEH